MKKINTRLIVIGFLFLFSCTNHRKEQETEAKNQEIRQTNQQIVNTFQKYGLDVQLDHIEEVEYDPLRRYLSLEELDKVCKQLALEKEKRDKNRHSCPYPFYVSDVCKDLPRDQQIDSLTLFISEGWFVFSKPGTYGNVEPHRDSVAKYIHFMFPNEEEQQANFSEEKE